ncbi:MAG: ATP-binding protein, partial [Methylococcaceae bacterium]
YSLCGLTIMGILILTVVSSIQFDRFLRDELRLRIGDVATMMAKNIDGDLHAKIQTVEDDKSSAFEKLKNNLWNMREGGTEITNAYTMRKLDNGEFVFIVDGSAKDQNATGDIYPNESVTETLKNALNATPENDAIYVESETTKDDWGVWLSAFAPIFTSSGKLDGIVGIDVSAKSIRDDQIEHLIATFIASLVVILITLPFVFKLMNFIRAINAEIEQANKDFRSLLDNSGQGFLSFGADLIIDEHYSLACETMLSQSPAGKNAADVFFQDDHTKAELFRTIISSALEVDDRSMRENMMSLLPVEIQRNQMTLSVEYKMLENDKFMVILTDITQERRIEATLKKQHKQLELIVAAVSDNRNFFDVVHAFRDFLIVLPKILTAEISPQIIVKDLYREIHTHKGTLNQFSFPNTPKLLHKIESNLSELVALGDSVTPTQIGNSILQNELQTAFDNDIAIITDKLGSNFIEHGENIILTRHQAQKMEKLANQLLRGEFVDISMANIRTLLDEISKLRKVTLKDVFRGFDGVVQKAAENMEKEVAPIIIKGGSDIWIDPQIYQAFLRSLVHVFRNTVAHGIESPEARWEADKDEIGKITCYAAVVSNDIKLTIADDGAGINLDAVRQKVITAGFYTADDVAKLSDDEVAKLIFMDNVSTQKEVTELAGCGVGLAAVLNETKNMGGDIVVKTVSGQGTQFIFTLPLPKDILNEDS